MNPYIRAPSAKRSLAMNGSSTSIGPSTTSTKMLANSSVHNSHGVASTNTKPSRRSRSTRECAVVLQWASATAWSRRAMPGRWRTARPPRRRRAPGTSSRPPRPRRPGRSRAGTPGAPRLRRRWPRATARRQDPRQDRAVGGKEERRRGTQGRRGHRQVPDLQSTKQSQHRDRRSTASTLTVSTAMMIARWLIRSAAIPPTNTNATRAAPKQVVTIDSDIGIVVEFDHLQRQSRPRTCRRRRSTAMTAAISRRYSRNRKGASTRHPPALRTGWSDLELRTHSDDGRRRTASSPPIFLVTRDALMEPLSATQMQATKSP